MPSRRRGYVPADVVCEPPLRTWPEAGVYQILFRILEDVQVRVGALGRFRFPVGLYIYTGRASRGLRARVVRHISGARRKRWHIDYLLAHHRCRVRRVALVSTNPDDECAANQSVQQDGSCPAPGFGASDCKQGCAAHLCRAKDARSESRLLRRTPL